jgi:hypothetical protein
MSREASIANISAAKHDVNEEAATLKAFLAIVAAVIVAAVGLGLTFGLAGIGGLAIFLAGTMLVVCVLLTAG